MSFCAVVIEASYPVQKNYGFCCTLKMIDISLQQQENEERANFAQMVVNAKRPEDLPFPKKLGDIIKVNGARCLHIDQ